MAKLQETLEKPKKQRYGPVGFLVETIHELRRVRWPKRREVVNFTAVALVLCFVMGTLVWAFDLGVAKLMSLIGLI